MSKHNTFSVLALVVKHVVFAAAPKFERYVMFVWQRRCYCGEAKLCVTTQTCENHGVLLCAFCVICLSECLSVCSCPCITYFYLSTRIKPSVCLPVYLSNIVSSYAFLSISFYSSIKLVLYIPFHVSINL